MSKQDPSTAAPGHVSAIFFHGMAIVVHLSERINGASPKRWLSGLVRGHDKSIQNTWEYLAIDGFQFPGGINGRFSSGIRLILRVTSMRVSCILGENLI